MLFQLNFKSVFVIFFSEKNHGDERSRGRQTKRTSFQKAKEFLNHRYIFFWCGKLPLPASMPWSEAFESVENIQRHLPSSTTLEMQTLPSQTPTLEMRPPPSQTPTLEMRPSSGTSYFYYFNDGTSNSNHVFSFKILRTCKFNLERRIYNVKRSPSFKNNKVSFQ